MLDAGPLGQLARRKRQPISNWVDARLAQGIAILIPEIADYEIRRSFLLHGLSESLQVLDDLRSALQYVPITTAAMRRAAGFWAEGRREGRPTAHPHALDCDVILAAQAMEANAAVVTENVGHLSRFVEAIDWRKSHLFLN